ncbi:MAG: protein tyrosine phosphatase (PTP) superfamily phosphohydrolase (DUF442 family) [Gammaproteobacteria bacterium]|jgi:protein tyrosine phosphatase (PTP) superfamily phosphohydrolase (DUF442 family)
MSEASINKTLEQIVNFYQIDENIATSGQPVTEQFQAISAKGFEVIINLALSDSPNAIEDENKIIKSLNMTYVHIPVDFKSPALEDLELFFKRMEKNHDKKIFIHCAMNWRVSAFMFLYHTIKCHMPIADAHKHLDAVWQPEPVWQDFIEHALNTYDSHP